MAILKSDLDGLMGLDGARLVIMRSPFQTDDGADAVGPVPTVPILTMMSATLQKRVAYGPTFPEMTFHQQYEAVRSEHAPQAT